MINDKLKKNEEKKTLRRKVCTWIELDKQKPREKQLKSRLIDENPIS